MLNVTPGQVKDIHALNLDFLRLVAEKEPGAVPGIDRSTHCIIKGMGEQQLQEIAQTDVLLFRWEDIEGEAATSGPGSDMAAFSAKVYMTARDFAREDNGLAISHLRITKKACSKYAAMGLVEIQEVSEKGLMTITPLGTTVFRMLGRLATPIERTQYVSLAAND